MSLPKRSGSVLVLVAGLFVLGSVGSVAAADTIYVGSQGRSVIAEVTLENWCFGSPETPAFHCETVSVSQTVPLP